LLCQKSGYWIFNSTPWILMCRLNGRN
jgi:hypothetical protein